MKLAAKFLLLLLSGAMLTSSLPAQPIPSPFPPQITHVLVIFQENRSPDNLFHFLSPLCSIPPGATGFAACSPNPVTSSCYDISPCGLSNKSGQPLPVTLKEIPMSNTGDPSHAHASFEQMCDPDPANGYACRNDGAWRILPGISYSYVQNTAVTNYNGSPGHLLDPYLTYAEQYGWANYMYQTNQGPSYPAHQFIFSGTSALSAADDAVSSFLSENPGKFSKGVGCLTPANGTATLLSPLLPGDTPCTGGKFFDNNFRPGMYPSQHRIALPGRPRGQFLRQQAHHGEFIERAKHFLEILCEFGWRHLDRAQFH
jgi:hypothetical protein